MKTPARVIVVLLLALTSSAFSQTLKLGVGGGVAFFAGDQQYTRDFSQGGFWGFGPLYSMRGKATLSLQTIPLTFTGNLSYHFASGSGDFNSELYQPALNGSTETKTHLLSIGLGGQWAFLSGPVSPYLGAQILVSSFGDFARKVTKPSGTAEYSSLAGTNYGLGVMIGTEIQLLPKVDLDINAVYNFDTLLGGTFYDTNIKTGGLSATILFTLN